MPVYKQHRLVHIHIPKTGGTAIEEQFFQLDDMTWSNDSWLGEVQRDGRWYEYQHLTNIEFRRLSDGEFDDFTAFAAIRDPYSRLVSEYLWRSSIANANPDSFLQSFDTFDAFVRAIPHDIDTNWDQLIASADMPTANLLIHTRPQYHYLVDDSHTINPSIRLLRYEHLKDDLEDFFAPLQITNTVVVNPAKRDVGDYFTDETISIVNERYQADFARLAYPLWA